MCRRLQKHHTCWGLELKDDGSEQPVFALSNCRFGKPILRYKSIRWEGSVLKFFHKDKNWKDPSVEYHRCIACFDASLRKRLEVERCPVASRTVCCKLSRITQRHPTRAIHCDWDGVTLHLRNKDQQRKTRKMPHQAFNEVVAGLAERFDGYDNGIQEWIKHKLTSGYEFQFKRRALSYNRHLSSFKNILLDNRLNELRVTVHNEAFLRHENTTPDKEMLKFLAEKNLKCLAAAETIMCDRNFAFTPTGDLQPRAAVYCFWRVTPDCLHTDEATQQSRLRKVIRCSQGESPGSCWSAGDTTKLCNKAVWPWDCYHQSCSEHVQCRYSSAAHHDLQLCIPTHKGNKREEMRSVCQKNPDVTVVHMREAPALFTRGLSARVCDMATTLPQGRSSLVTVKLSNFKRYFQNF